MVFIFMFGGVMAASGQGVGWQPGEWLDVECELAEGLDKRDRLVAEAGDTGPDSGELWPITGRWVKGVVPDSLAERLGIQAGDVITQMDDQLLISKEDFNRLRIEDSIFGPHQQAFTIVRPGVEVRRVQVRPGLLGISHYPNQRRTGWYLRFGQRDAAWDKWMIAAAEADAREEYRWVGPLLAKAVAAGYTPDPLSDALIFEALLDFGRWEEASRLVEHVSGFDAEERPWGVWAFDRYIAARAGGRWSLMVDILQKAAGQFADADPEEQVAWLEGHGLRSMPAGPTPVELADGVLQKARVNRRMQPVEGGIFGDHAMALLDEVNGDVPFRAKQRPGRFLQAMVTSAEGFGDFEVRGEFILEPTGPAHPQWYNALTIHVVDLSEAGGWDDFQQDYWQGPHIVLGLTVKNFGPPGSQPAVLAVQGHGISGLYGRHAPWFVTDGKTLHTVRLVRLGAMGQVQVDGRTLMVVPLDPDAKNLAVHLHMVGHRVEFKRFDIVRLNHFELPPGMVQRQPEGAPRLAGRPLGTDAIK